MPSTRSFVGGLLFVMPVLFSTLLFAQDINPLSYVIAKSDFEQKQLMIAKAAVENQSWLSWLLDHGKMLLPLYYEIKLRGNVPDVSVFSGTLGNNLEQQRIALTAYKPLPEFEMELSTILGRLMFDNPSVALTYASIIVHPTSLAEQQLDLLTVLQLLYLGIIIYVIYRYRMSLKAYILQLVRRVVLRRLFYTSAALWIGLGIIIRIPIHYSTFEDRRDLSTLLDLESLVSLVFGTATIVLGGILLYKWMSAKGKSLVSSLPAFGTSKDAQTDTLQNTDRWSALVRYDDDIRGAVEQLRPLGERWVDELRKAYFALNEDKQYLPNIVARLKAEGTALCTGRRGQHSGP